MKRHSHRYCLPPVPRKEEETLTEGALSDQAVAERKAYVIFMTLIPSLDRGDWAGVCNSVWTLQTVSS